MLLIKNISSIIPKETTGCTFLVHIVIYIVFNVCKSKYK